MLSIVPARHDLKSNRNLFDGSSDLAASVLPTVQGAGLTQAEMFRLNRAENTARAEYARSMPEADSIEIHRVGAAAAADALRAVLRDRAPAPCCDHDEPAPCSACVDVHSLPVGADEHMTEEELAELEELNRLNPAGAFETDLSRFPAFDRWPAFTENFRWVDPSKCLLTLPELIDHEAKRLRARGNEAAELMAGALEDLARIVRTVDAARPDQVWERVSILDRDFSEPCEYVPELTSAGRWA